MRLEAGENTSVTTSENKTSAASIGASFSPQGLSGLSLSASSAKGKSKESRTSYTPTKVKAAGTLKLESGKDTNILGSKAKGEKIEANVGGNLTIETLQEKETYEEKNTSAGFNLSWSMNQMLDPAGSDKILRSFSKPTVGASVSKGSLESHYRSAHEQAGLFAGKDGFDIYVEKNTDLKGGLIASEARSDKNKLSTGTFSFSDLHNEAAYIAKDTGSSAQIKPTLVRTKEKTPEGNKKGRLKVVQALHSIPSIPTVVQGSADSTTKAAVAPGTIDIRENPTQDISALNRDTANALNELGRIFDKKSVEEQKELVNVFREEAFRLLHDLPDDGSGRKVLLHSIVGGLISQFAGAGFASGAAGAGLNEALINNLKGLDPTLAQIISGVLGAAAAKAINGNATAGATAAASGTKYNLNLEDLKGKVPYIQEVYERIENLKNDVAEQAMNEALYLVSSGNLVLKDMKADYMTIQLGVGEGLKTGSTACTVDKFGNVYATIAFAPGVVVGVPINTGLGWLFNLSNSATKQIAQGSLKEEDLPNLYRKEIPGWGGSFTAIGGIGGTIGLSGSGIIAEFLGSGSAGLNLTIGLTFYVGTIEE